MKGRRFLVVSLALALSLALFGVAQAAGLFATDVPYYHLESMIPGGDYTIEYALKDSPDGNVAVWNMEAHNKQGAVALDMGQQVCGPLYVYANPPGASVWGVVAVKHDAPTASNYSQIDGGNYLHASDYDTANGRYTVKQFFIPGAPQAPANPIGLSSTPYTDSFQGVVILNVGLDENGYPYPIPLTLDAVEGSPCVSRTLKGFYQPVDMSTETSLVYNTVKGGATVPLKFEIFDGETEITSVDAVKPLTYAATSCDANATSDVIEETVATGGTSLRYDTTAGQFVYNWQTPKTAGCYRVTVTAQAGPSLVAYFKLK